MLSWIRPSRPSQIARFFSAPEHRWLWENKNLRARLTEVFLRMSKRQLGTFFGRRPLLLYSNGKMSCAFHQFRGRQVVLIFPDLLELLASHEYAQGQAILAHEFGHIVLGHASAAISQSQAQMEADAFAASLGFGPELSRALASFSDSNEVPSRIRSLPHD